MKITYQQALSIILPLLVISAGMNIYFALKGENDMPAASPNLLRERVEKATAAKAISVADKVQGMLNQSRLARYEKDYAAFFAKYPMGEEKKNLIYSALANESQALLDSALKRQAEGKDINSDTIKSEREERIRQFEKTLREPLGDKVFEALVYYRVTAPQREMAGLIAEKMKESGCGPDADIVDRMARLFKDKRIMYANEQGMARAPALGKAMAGSLARNETAVMKDASDFLSQQQMDVLKQAWGELASNAAKQGADK